MAKNTKQEIQNMLEEIERESLDAEAEKALSRVLEEAASRVRLKREAKEKEKKNTWWIVRWKSTCSEVSIFQAVVEKGGSNLKIIKPKVVKWSYVTKSEMRRTRKGALKLAVKEYHKQIASLEKRIERDKAELPKSRANLKELEKELAENYNGQRYDSHS